MKLSKMKLLCLLMIVFLFMNGLSVAASQPITHKELAEYHSPIAYQDVNANSDAGRKSDFITNFDFDGDWKGNNNWENINSPLKAYVYYLTMIRIYP